MVLVNDLQPDSHTHTHAHTIFCNPSLKVCCSVIVAGSKWCVLPPVPAGDCGSASTEGLGNSLWRTFNQKRINGITQLPHGAKSKPSQKEEETIIWGTRDLNIFVFYITTTWNHATTFRTRWKHIVNHANTRRATLIWLHWKSHKSNSLIENMKINCQDIKQC